MLSRVAESLTWLSRYVERAEMLARTLDVALHRTVDRSGDRAASAARVTRVWSDVLETAGLPAEHDGVAGALERAVFATESASTIVGCVRAARANAVSVRAELPSEVWEAINGLYLYVEAQSAARLAADGPSSFLRRVRDAGQGFAGVVDATLTHDEEWEFVRIGRYLERAQNVARAVRRYDAASETPSEAQRLLETCCASEPFARARRSAAGPGDVLAFLLLHRRSPRSVRFCVHEVDTALRRISGSLPGAFRTEAERLTGRTAAWLDYTQIAEVLDEGVAAFAQRLVGRLDAVGAAVESEYFPRVPVG